MYRLFALAIGITLFSCGGGGSSTGKTDCSVEINGDSILVGPGLAETPIQTLQRINPSLVITNKSVIGLTMGDLLNGYTTPYENGPIEPQPPFATIQRNSKYIVIEVGGNDALGSIELYESQLRSIIIQVLAEKRIPILTGIVQLSPGTIFDANAVLRTRQVNAIQHKLAFEFGIPMSSFDTGSFDSTTDTIDGIHRSQAASITLMNKLNETIQMLDAKCSK